MAVEITAVRDGSPAAEAGIKAGMHLVAINGRQVLDVLDYEFYQAAENPTFTVIDSGEERSFELLKGQYDDPGLDFPDYLMSEQKRCQNKCIFCFIDQLPSGMREPLYFKDDDERLSFFFGNYTTLTNLTDRDIDRIIEMHISPINISVHTTDPALRCMVMGNRFAGEKLRYLYRLAKAGIEINCQIVLCRGINDGDHLRITLKNLAALYPAVRSIAVVPAGLTAHREGLFKLQPYDAASAAEVLSIVESIHDECVERFSDGLVYPSDEWYILTGRDIPELGFYGDLLQLENGVGMLALFSDQFMSALAAKRFSLRAPKADIITGESAAESIKDLVSNITARYPRAKVRVHVVKNEFFGGNVTVAGLLTGRDIMNQVSPEDLIPGSRVMLPASVLRADGDLLLDDTTPADLENHFGRPVCFTSGGDDLLEAILGN